MPCWATAMLSRVLFLTSYIISSAWRMISRLASSGYHAYQAAGDSRPESFPVCRSSTEGAHIQLDNRFIGNDVFLGAS
jgi:hypothetical protein